MDNRTLAQKFSEGATKGKGSHMFIDGDTIYSYGYHFPIAKRIDNGTYLFNEEGYSSTTAKQKSYVRGELNKGNILPSTTDGIKRGVAIEKKYANSMKGIRDWQSDHPNFLTPDVDSVTKIPGGYVEVSSTEHGIDGKTPLYGVTTIKYDDKKNTFESVSGQSFKTQDDALMFATGIVDFEKTMGKPGYADGKKKKFPASVSAYEEKKNAESRQKELDNPHVMEQRFGSEFEKQLQKGIAVEMEHTSDKKVAEKIARDHLAEIPDYYTRLNKLENQAKAEGEFIPSLGMGLCPPARSSTRRSGRSRRSM